SDLPPCDHVLPLSGVFDSRAILAHFLEHFDASQINTVTFGSPGTWDYDIGCLVAKKVGTKHLALDLNRVKVSTSDLVEYQTTLDAPIVMIEAFLHYQLFRIFWKSSHYWIGYMGDPLAGSHLYKQDASWGEALQHFIEKNKYTKVESMAPPDYDPMQIFPSKPFIDNDILSYYDQCDFGFRQQCYIKPIVFPKGYSCKAPFLAASWVSFILQVPYHYRKGRRLFLDIVTKAFPEIFALPTKTNLGLPLHVWGVRRKLRKYFVNRGLYTLVSGSNLYPKTNYIDFDLAFRNREEWRKIAVENLEDLDRRGTIPWLDVGQSLSKYDAGQMVTRDIALLISLETYLKA